VREELSELFQFINNDFLFETKIRLLLVIFIDDLDRVLEGRNVKMLEAMQLLLNVPGAPVFLFLAIDSRIIVSSIEQQINKHANLKSMRITGWEYLDKIVQIPFCIPEVSPERMQHFLEKTLRVTISDEKL
jgi:predicted KAP-like P-loop ATPase